MADLQIRNRHRLRDKDVAALNDRVEAAFGVRPFPEGGAVDRADAGAHDVVVHDGRVVALLEPTEEDPVGRAILTVRGMLAHRPQGSHVTVDMGAVPHVHNGADVMAPGITEADPAIEVGDLVWIRDERNGQPLAVAEALMTGPEMADAGSGKAARALHHVGDEVWELQV